MSAEVDKEVELIGTIALVALAPVIIPLSTAINAWVLMHLWVWFAVPLFGLPPLSFWEAVGVGTLVMFLTQYSGGGSNKESSWSVLVGVFVRMVLWNGMALAVGFAAHRCM